MPKNTRVSGHGLEGEGTPHSDDGKRTNHYYGGTSGEGRGRCSCGVLSPVLPSGAARRKWHNGHKERVLAAGGLHLELQEGEKKMAPGGYPW